ncbi:MAG TPA: tetratricopeptide repeat protein [Acidobacteriota bacterium]|nr:tetratricopeptide repeat protein [Acidobacteriota bacterium]
MLKRTILLSALLLSGCSQSLLVQGRRLVDEGEYERAIEVFYRQIAQDPRQVDAWKELGIAFYKSGDLIRAEDALKKAGKADPATHLYLGLVLESRGEDDLAVRAYTSALKLRPGGETESLVRAHLDGLIRRTIDRDVARAIENESSLDVASIPPNTIAVADFDGSLLPPETAPIARGLAELTAADLASVRSLRLVERLKVDALLRELELAGGGYVDATQAPRMGRLLGSNRIVTGSVLGIGDDRIRLDGAIVSTVDSTSDVTEPSEGKLVDFFRVQKELVFNILDDLGVELTAAERDAIREVPTESFLAFLSYCRGLEYRNRGLLEEARNEFQQAVNQDENFSAARQEMESAATGISAMQQGGVTAADVEAAVVRDARNAELIMGQRLTRVVTNSGAITIPTGVQPRHTTTPISTPEAERNASVVVRGDLDAD